MKQEKTALEWFDMLIEPYRSQAKENVTDERLQNFYPKLHYALIATFTWEDTAQGHDYWSGVVESLELNETTYLKPTQPQFGTWISVEDGLPNSFTEVILFREDAGVFLGYFGSLEDKLSDEDKGFLSEEVLFEISFFSYEYDGIHPLELDTMPTFWMPLPPNPTK